MAHSPSDFQIDCEPTVRYSVLMKEAYIFQADVWCPECTRKLLIEQFGVQDNPEDTEAMLLVRVLVEAGRDPRNEANWDSDEFPKGPFSDGGGEADTPQHCSCCRVFLENPLTQEGYAYVIEALNDDHGDPEVEAQWRDFYSEDHYKGRPVLEYLNQTGDTFPTVRLAVAFWGLS